MIWQETEIRGSCSGGEEQLFEIRAVILGESIADPGRELPSDPAACSRSILAGKLDGGQILSLCGVDAEEVWSETAEHVLVSVNRFSFHDDRANQNPERLRVRQPASPISRWTRREKGRYLHTVISAEQANELGVAIKNHTRVLALLARWSSETARELEIKSNRK